MTIEVDVFHHMRVKIDSCKTLKSTADKDNLILEQEEEIQRKQLIIDKLDRYVYDLAGAKEEEEIKLFNLTKDYTKLSKKKKRGMKVVIGVSLGAIAGAVALKHNYDIQKNR